MITVRLDHVAFRVVDKDAALFLLKTLLGYEEAEPFEIVFEDGTKVECMALIPQERVGNIEIPFVAGYATAKYHAPPEVFVSEGQGNSIVDDWVAERNMGLGGVHHLAYQVDNIDEVVNQWKEHLEFSSDIIDCPDDNLRQIFTKPIKQLGGLIIELIERGDKGFCGNSVKKLMEATKEE